MPICIWEVQETNPRQVSLCQNELGMSWKCDFLFCDCSCLSPTKGWTNLFHQNSLCFTLMDKAGRKSSRKRAQFWMYFLYIWVSPAMKGWIQASFWPLRFPTDGGKGQESWQQAFSVNTGSCCAAFTEAPLQGASCGRWGHWQGWGRDEKSPDIWGECVLTTPLRGKPHSMMSRPLKTWKFSASTLATELALASPTGESVSQVSASLGLIHNGLELMQLPAVYV